jgi:beta-N-acetylhexosaminidase
MTRLRRRRLLAMGGALAATACLSPAPARALPSPVASAEIAQMSIDERVGQLMTVAFHGKRITSHLESLIRKRHVGGVIVFAENVGDASELRALAADLQRIAKEAGARPLFIAIDHEGGSVIRVARGLTVLPGAMALAATPDPVASVERASGIAALELRSTGVTWDLAPVADVNDEPKNAILLNRSFGSDPKRVGELASAWIRGHARSGVLSCAKHFPGHGSTTVDSHTGLPDLTHDRARLDRVELVPFKAAIAAGVPTIMTAHIVMRAIDADQPATLSTKVLEGILRKDLAFDGVIVTDDLEMDALKTFGGVADVAVRSIAAGADHALFRFDEDAQKAGHQKLVEAFRSGRIPIARLDRALRRVLAAKAWQAGAAQGEARPDGAANAAAANELAQQAVTVLRNQGVLPLRGRILAIAVDRPDITLLPDNVTIGDALRERGASVTPLASPQRPSASQIASATAAARSADVVVITTADLQANPQQAELVRALAALKPTAMVSLRSPYDALGVPAIPAYVCAYYGRAAAVNAVAEVLLGKAKPQGRLPVEIPGLWSIGAGMSSL